MGLLRTFCLISVVVSLIIGAVAYVDGTPIGALVPLCFGAVALVVVLPLPAYERARRGRVMAACLFYTAAAALSFIIANVLDTSTVNLLLSVPPLSGAVLSAWALKTRHRRRVAGFSNYYDA
ncbi:hypothetical protein [Sphingomonas phyllosphaerae]|jgi:hypothetical protein|uniref:hypothetical protein n=1 Tax=Sphingomonas phyllosphaerae TaxID=257003 RepID=UPI0003B5DB9A|nr:hypothetical protein [Sphingomonas phyllosphaerae]